MSEQFLTLMADLDRDSQNIFSEWYNCLKDAGFTGTQTPDLPYHISLAKIPIANEQAAIELMKKIAEGFSAIHVHISHIGLFAGGNVLFAAPDISSELLSLHSACSDAILDKCPWVPHITLLIDEPGTVCAALSALVKSFYPFIANIVRLHLCAFWPTREIAAISLKNEV